MRKQYEQLHKEYEEYCSRRKCIGCEYDKLSCSCFALYITHKLLNTEREVELQFLKEIDKKHSLICVLNHRVCNNCELKVEGNRNELQCYHTYLLTNLLMEV